MESQSSDVPGSLHGLKGWGWQTLSRPPGDEMRGQTSKLELLSINGARDKMTYPDAGWSSQVAREAHNLEVVGSNPAPAIYSNPTVATARPWVFCCAGDQVGGSRHRRRHSVTLRRGPWPGASRHGGAAMCLMRARARTRFKTAIGPYFCAGPSALEAWEMRATARAEMRKGRRVLSIVGVHGFWRASEKAGRREGNCEGPVSREGRTTLASNVEGAAAQGVRARRGTPQKVAGREGRETGGWRPEAGHARRGHDGSFGKRAVAAPGLFLAESREPIAESFRMHPYTYHKARPFSTKILVNYLTDDE